MGREGGGGGEARTVYELSGGGLLRITVDLRYTILYGCENCDILYIWYPTTMHDYMVLLGAMLLFNTENCTNHYDSPQDSPQVRVLLKLLKIHARSLFRP